MLTNMQVWSEVRRRVLAAAVAPDPAALLKRLHDGLPRPPQSVSSSRVTDLALGPRRLGEQRDRGPGQPPRGRRVRPRLLEEVVLRHVSPSFPPKLDSQCSNQTTI